jgi:hypothetical protein
MWSSKDMVSAFFGILAILVSLALLYVLLMVNGISF